MFKVTLKTTVLWHTEKFDATDNTLSAIDSAIIKYRQMKYTLTKAEANHPKCKKYHEKNKSACGHPTIMY